MKKPFKEEVFTCLHCGNKTSNKLLGMHTQPFSLGIDPNSGDEVFDSIYIYFFECSTCSGITVKYLYPEDFDGNVVSFDYVKTLYPQERIFPDDMPARIVKAYKEASKVKRVSSQAFVILIRKGLEILCEDQKVKGRSLAEKIKQLVEKGALPGAFSEMVNQIRMFGNIGAHDLDSDFSKEQVDTIDYFFTAVLEYVYIAPSKLERLKNSIGTKKQLSNSNKIV